MWKQDIGQWVERKGHRGWIRQPQQLHQQHPSPQQQPQQSHQQQQQQHSASLRAAARVGFLPEGFEDRDGEAAAVPVHPTPAAHVDGGGKEPPREGQCWVTVYGVSPMNIMGVREYLDVMFGRTAEHYCPAGTEATSDEKMSTLDKGQNWFYVKFENPISAARAVCQSPLTISVDTGCSVSLFESDANATATLPKTRGGGNVLAREEVVGVAWCTDLVFLQRESKQEQQHRETESYKNVGSHIYGGGPLKSDDAKNALGTTPCGTERGSRGLGSVLRDVFFSPWKGRWSATPSCGDSSFISSPTHTEAFHEDREGTCRGPQLQRGAVHDVAQGAYAGADNVPQKDIAIPSCLFSRDSRHICQDPARHVHNAVPLCPLPGNLSVLSAFRADESQRRLPQRVVRALKYIPSRIFCFLTSPSSFNLAHEEEDGLRDSEWGFFADVFNSDRRHKQQRQMLRQRHYNAAARLRPANGGNENTVAITSWTPYRWYENSAFLSLFILFLVVILFYYLSGDGNSFVDIEPSGARGTPDATATIVPSGGGQQGVSRTVLGQVVGTMFKGDTYTSDIYTARTL